MSWQRESENENESKTSKYYIYLDKQTTIIDWFDNIGIRREYKFIDNNGSEIFSSNSIEPNDWFDEIPDKDFDKYEKLGLAAEPFKNVQYYYPFSIPKTRHWNTYMSPEEVVNEALRDQLRTVEDIPDNVDYEKIWNALDHDKPEGDDILDNLVRLGEQGFD